MRRGASSASNQAPLRAPLKGGHALNKRGLSPRTGSRSSGEMGARGPHESNTPSSLGRGDRGIRGKKGCKEGKGSSSNIGHGPSQSFRYVLQNTSEC